MKLTYDNRVDRHANLTTVLDPAEAVVEQAIKALDGVGHTEVLLEQGTQLSIGGGVGQYVVSMFTADERSLVAISPSAPNSDEKVKLVAGGQKISVPRRQVLSVEHAVAAALHFLRTGHPDKSLTWEEA